MRVLHSLLVLLVLAAPRSVEAYTLDRAWAVNADAASGTTIQFVYAGAVASNALLVCFIEGGHLTNGVVKDMSDSVNGAWTAVTGTGVPVTAGGLGFAWNMWFYLTSAAGTPTVTATFVGSVINRGIACGSYAPTAGSTFAFDVGKGNNQQNAGTGANDQTTGATGATATTNELAIAGLITQNGVTVTAGTTLAWVERFNNAFATFQDVHVEDFNVPTSATVTATWGINNGAADSETIVGVFKETAAASSGAKNCLLLGVCG